MATINGQAAQDYGMMPTSPQAIQVLTRTPDPKNQGRNKRPLIESKVGNINLNKNRLTLRPNE